MVHENSRNLEVPLQMGLEYLEARIPCENNDF